MMLIVSYSKKFLLSFLVFEFTQKKKYKKEKEGIERKLKEENLTSIKGNIELSPLFKS